ncbi:MarR family winged helix-turn-helix transcriptional regulator [Aliiroseovarius sp. F47248L]|uniref:MarR family winged helix-turn-helix transcriptional regulator n=1 Tax=Aliiroseovarius sp. F47248L TaxID=2926420 RepID=UPI001FF17F2D|nr:MarR family winged helix-turn-helix transcriptional regulator [Aliiroseovarius sp. F47248L]MCK0139820.1 MarR family winged helix-turn-helix transcriptional regulator [Aliiroseovarius sp. F47248L]
MTGANWPKGTQNQSFGFLSQVLARRVDQAMKKQLADLNLDFRFFMTLMQLLAEDGQSQRELGAKLSLPEYQVSRNLDTMAADGLIERRTDPSNRRTTLVFLTANGRELAQQLPPLINNLNDSFLSALTHEERVTLINMLQRILSLTD